MLVRTLRRFGPALAGSFAALLGGGASGCATTSANAHADVAAELTAAERQIAALEAQNRAQAEELRRLRTQLAIAQGDARPAAHRITVEPRETETAWDEPPAEAARDGAAATPVVAAAEDANEDEGSRPVLSLRGAPPEGVDLATVDERLPTTPDVPPVVAVTPAADAAAANGGTSGGERRARELYRAALGHVSARRFDRALESLTRFLDAYPRHPYADDALYWRGTTYYALRQYTAALNDFLRVIADPGGNKVPDALFQIGMCHVRMGDPRRARAYFQRVQTEYPNTVAARLASREDAT